MTRAWDPPLAPGPRMAHPTARDAARAVCDHHGACLRPIQLRRTNTDTGQVDQVLVPCGATLAMCARRARNGPRSCAPPNAGKAGTWILNPSPPAPAR